MLKLMKKNVSKVSKLKIEAIKNRFPFVPTIISIMATPLTNTEDVRIPFLEFCLTEGSIHTTISPNLQFWNIAEICGTWHGDVSLTGSKTASSTWMEPTGQASLCYKEDKIT
jgi:hypothetical protein